MNEGIENLRDTGENANKVFLNIELAKRGMSTEEQKKAWMENNFTAYKELEEKLKTRDLTQEDFQVKLDRLINPPAI